MSCLSILEINPLSFVSFAPTLRAVFFTLLIVSFAVQKLLSLIRPHLFTFVFISITLGGGSKQEDLALIYVIQCSAYVFL